MSNALEYELAQLIIDFCNVEDVTPEEISSDTSLADFIRKEQG